MSCLQNIVTIGDPCDEEVSLSGLTLYQAPEISPVNSAEIANEKHTSGKALLQEVLNLSIAQVRNDFIGVLSSNRIATNILQVTHSTSEYKGGALTPFAGERGITLFRSKGIKGKLRKVRITAIEVWPLTDVAEININIYDNGLVYRYPVELVANQLNTFTVDHVMQGSFARVLIDNTALDLASSYVTCKTGCDGREPNDCGYALGYDGSTEIREREGYGINVKFQCFCDYEALLCDLAPAYFGEIIWLKARYNFLEQHYKSNRFENIVIYGREEAKEEAEKIDGLYREKWNLMLAGLRGTLGAYRDDCVECKGIRWVG